MSKEIYSEHYEVQELIAEGGMGAVYKAWDNKLEIVVALKVVHSHLSRDADFVERFRDEARKTARLRGHTNIVQIFSVENDQGTEYLVMEYFPSTNLRDQLRTQGKFPVRDAVNVTRQIAHALSYTHSWDIIHRDIKPANILLDSNQKVKLTDFGIAKALNEAPLTSTGQLIGTIKYMSPEQARNTILDGRTDLYSLGMVFYEMVTGQNLWKDVPNLAIYGNLQAESTIPALKFPPDVPPGIQGVIKDLLRFQSTDRIQTAEDLVVRLEDLRDTWSNNPSGKKTEDSDATIVKPQIEEPKILEDDKTVAVLHPSSSGPSGQKPPIQSKKPPKTKETPVPKQKMAPVKEKGRPHVVAPFKEALNVNRTETNTKKTIRNSVFAVMISLVLFSLYYFGTSDSGREIVQNMIPNTTKTAELKGSPSLTIDENEGEFVGKDPVAEEPRETQENAEEQVFEGERVAQVNGAAKAQEEQRAREAEALAKAQAAEEARVVMEKAMAAEEARVAQEKAKAEEEARVMEKAMAAEDARVAQEKAKAAEEARVAQEKAKTAEEEARVVMEKAMAAEEVRVAKAKAKADEETRVAQEKAKAAGETQALRNLLDQLQRSIAKRDLVALKKMSTMSDSRQKMLRDLFARYQTIETSIGDLTRSADKATVILQFTKFIRPNGEIIQPSRFLKTTNVVIPKNADGWGLADW